MKKMFAIVVPAAVLALSAVAGCHSKKPTTAPPVEKASPESGAATGGAAYGGQKTDAPASKDTPKPDAPH